MIPDPLPELDFICESLKEKMAAKKKQFPWLPMLASFLKYKY